jgi:prephenate dehydrogenase
MEKVGVIGGRGGFGKWIADLCSSHSVSLIESDIDSEISNTEVARRARIVFVCVPIGATQAVLEQIEPHLTTEHLLVDLTSVKTPFLEILARLPSEVLSLHPMFAPTVGSGHGQSCVSCAIRSGHRSRHVTSWFSARGVRMIPMEPGEHDRMMAVVQGLTHFQAISAAHCMMRLGFNVQESVTVSSPVYRLRLAMIGRILGHDPRLYAEIQTYNPHIPDVLRALAHSSALLQEHVESRDVSGFVAECEKIKQAFGDFTTRSVAESERIIATLARSTS